MTVSASTFNDLAISSSSCQFENDLLDDFLFLFNAPPQVSVSSQSNDKSAESCVFDTSDMESNQKHPDKIVVEQRHADDAFENISLSSVSQESVHLFDYFSDMEESISTNTKAIVIENDQRNHKPHDLNRLKKTTTKPSDIPSCVQSKRRRGRPKRDPLEGWPKRPLSAYNIFFQRERLNVRKMIKEQVAIHGESFSCNVTQTVANTWKYLTNEEKAPYKELAAIDMKKYRKQVAAHKRKQQAAKCIGSINDSCKSSSPRQDEHECKRSEYSDVDDDERDEKRRKCTHINTSESQPKNLLSRSLGYNVFFQHELKRLRYSQITMPSPFSCKISQSTTSSCEEDNSDESRVTSLGDVSKIISDSWQGLAEVDREFYDAVAMAK